MTTTQPNTTDPATLQTVEACVAQALNVARANKVLGANYNEVRVRDNCMASSSAFVAGKH